MSGTSRVGSSLEARLYLLRHPENVPVLQKKTLWYPKYHLEKNPLMEIARKSSRDPEVNQKLLGVARVLIEEHGAEVNARFWNEDSRKSFWTHPVKNDTRINLHISEGVTELDLDQSWHHMEMKGPGVLEIAAYNGFPEKLPFIRLLLENGAKADRPVEADLVAKESKLTSPLTAIEIAKARGHQQAVDLLSGCFKCEGDLTDRIRAKPNLEKQIKDSKNLEVNLRIEVFRFNQDLNRNEAIITAETEKIQKLEQEILERKAKIAETGSNITRKRKAHELRVVELMDDPSYLNKKRRRDLTAKIESVDSLIKAVRDLDEMEEGAIEKPD